MRLLKKYSYFFTLVFALLSSSFLAAQTGDSTVVKQDTFTPFSTEGTVTIEQDERIPRLLALKKKVNKEEGAANMYRIQLYSGSRVGAANTIQNFRKDFPYISCSMNYEAPEFKVRVGNFRTSIEADRRLLEIRKKYPAAFKFQPKKR